MGRSVNQRIAALKNSLEALIEPVTEHPHKQCWAGKWDTAPSTPGTSARQLLKAPKPPPETGEPCPCGDPRHIFFASAPAKLPTGDLMRRLIKYMEFGDDDVLFAVAFMYLQHAVERYREISGQSLVTVYSAHRTFFACCVLAAKFGQEKPFKNKFYRDVGGLLNGQVMLQLELQMLLLLDYRLFPSTDEFREMYTKCFEVPPPQSPASVKRPPPVGLEFVSKQRRDSLSKSNRRDSSSTVSPLPFDSSPSVSPPPDGESSHTRSTPLPGWAPADAQVSSFGDSPLPRIPSKLIMGSCDDILSFATGQPSEEDGNPVM